MWSFTGAIGRTPTHVQGGGSGSLCRTHDGMGGVLQPPGLRHAENSARKSGVTLDLRRGDPEATGAAPIDQSAAAIHLLIHMHSQSHRSGSLILY